MEYEIANVLDMSSSMIKAEDADFLKDHLEEFKKRFRTRAIFRSKTEMKFSVLSDEEHPTPDSKYWQAIGEQNVQVTELISLDFGAKEFEADIELLEVRIEELKEKIIDSEGFEKKKLKVLLRKKEIQLSKKNFGMIQMEKTAKERMREIRDWEPLIQDLHKQLKYGDEDFDLHHAERYHLRYKIRMENLQFIEGDAKESVIRNYKSFTKAFEEEQHLTLKSGSIASESCQIDYKDFDEMKEADSIAKGYFDRKVNTLIVGAPHRSKEDRNATNFDMMQPPAGFNCSLKTVYGYSVPDARNLIVKIAIEEGIDYIFFVDDDVIIPRNALVTFIKHKADVVGGMYYRKYFPLETVGMHEDKEGRPGSMDDYKIGDIIHDTLVLPSGCTLFNVNTTFKKMEPPWYKTITVGGRATITEDTYVCQRLKDMDIDIITDTNIQCVHVDINKGIFYGHPEIIDAEQNVIRPEYRDYFAIGER